MSGRLAVVEPGTVFEDPSEVTEVLATPRQTGDRYQLRLTIRPGGGPGIRGSGVHLHPGLVEIFQCVSGTMTTRLGRDVGHLAPGKKLEVPAGAVHGLKNSGDGELIVDVDLVFTPPGPRPEADLMAIGLEIADLVRDGRVNRRTGYPPVLQMAVIETARPEAMRHAGLVGMVMPALAVLGRLRGY